MPTSVAILNAVLVNQRRALELALSDAPLSEILDVLVRTLEDQAGEGVLASILLLDEDGRHLRLGAAPNLPVAYARLIDGMEIGPNAGSCGAAAWLREPVIVPDVAVHPAWDRYREVGLREGIRACWSSPILSSRSKLLGSFALYYRQTGEPEHAHREILDLVSHTAALVIERERERRERHRAEEALSASERNFALVTDMLPIFIAYVDRDERYRFVNAFYESWFGVKAEGVIGRKLRDVLDEATYAPRKPHMDAALRGERQVFYADVVSHKGDKLLLQNTYIPDFGPAGEVRGFIVLSQDRSEDFRHARELEAARDAAEAANLAKSSFLANMSHEIRTPLGAIMGFTDLLGQRGLTQEEVSAYLSIINRNSSQLLRIIDDILDLTKVEAGKMPIEAIEFSLTDFMGDFASLMRLRASENAIDFSLKARTLVPENIASDPVRLRQVLMNAVGNAIKFTERGRVELEVGFEHDRLDFVITDTGRGISPEQQASLFQPFVQADASTTRKFGGTGLGLVLCKRLCEAMGGHFVLRRSELGVGSVFAGSVKVRVPDGVAFVDLAQARLSSTDGVAASDPRRLSGRSILVVEDSPDNQVLIRILLSRAGAKVEIASDGLQGVEKALGARYDAVLMDVQMPRMDGHEATRRLRSLGYDGRIIALTAHAMKEERLRCLESGFSDFLAKPINREEILTMLEK